MNLDERRHSRIQDLYQKALTGKFKWHELKKLAIRMGVTKVTANSYLDSVHEMLVKGGHIKA